MQESRVEMDLNFQKMNCDSEEANMETVDNIFSLVFGDSDTEDDVGSEDADGPKDQWVKVDEVEGLWHCNQFLSVQHQMTVTKEIATEGWFAEPRHNQAMRFGDLPVWGLDLCGLIRRSIRSYKSAVTADLLEDMRDIIGPLPSRILERNPLFDQMVANSYQPGEGIKAHVDLMRFEDGVAILSLESTCVMSFARVGDSASSSIETESGKQCQDSMDDVFQPWSSFSEEEVSLVRERDPNSGLAKRVDVLLKPGDLIVSYGPARYLWTHEIDRSKDNQVWSGKTIEQHQRISVTLRRLCPQRDTE